MVALSTCCIYNQLKSELFKNVVLEQSENVVSESVGSTVQTILNGSLIKSFHELNSIWNDFSSFQVFRLDSKMWKSWKVQSLHVN